MNMNTRHLIILAILIGFSQAAIALLYLRPKALDKQDYPTRYKLWKPLLFISLLIIVTGVIVLLGLSKNIF